MQAWTAQRNSKNSGKCNGRDSLFLSLFPLHPLPHLDTASRQFRAAPKDKRVNKSTGNTLSITLTCIATSLSFSFSISHNPLSPVGIIKQLHHGSSGKDPRPLVQDIHLRDRRTYCPGHRILLRQVRFLGRIATTTVHFYVPVGRSSG